MKKILLNLGLVSGCLVFSAIHSQVEAQTRTITGTVKNGEKPLSGVVVTQEGSSQMTTTTATGAFSLQITGENPILIFRHPEYGERKINTDGKSTFTIALTEKVKTIEEVVLNAGYYNVKAKESTGSISKVTAKEIENQPVNNVLSAVQGRMAGVNITQNSGNPGGGYDVQIRGRNSLRNEGNKVLYILDGVPLPNGNDFLSGLSAAIIRYEDTSPLNMLNPNDIESIEVLKDADATAIYGSKGANGVVLITTKKGKKGKTAVQLNTSYGIGEVADLPKMMNTEQYLKMRKDAFENDGIVQFPISAYDINGTWDKGKYTDWQKYFVGGKAEQTSNKLSFSGGNERTQFLFSVGHDEETTVFPSNYRYKRTTAGLNLNHQTADKRLKINLMAYYTLQNNFLPPTDFFRVYPYLAPNAPNLFTPSGTYNWENSTFANPLAANSQEYKTGSKQLTNNIVVKYEILKSLELQLNLGYTNTDEEETRIYPKRFYNPAGSNYTSEKSAFRLYTTERESWMVEPQLNFNKTFGNHLIQALVGSTFQEQKAAGRGVLASNFPSEDFIENIASAASLKAEASSNYQYRFHSVFARIAYQYKHRYILNLTGRKDASSRFGPNKRFANFGAIGAAWLFSEETFFKNQQWLSYGKLRGSYGTTGNDQIGNYQFYDTYTVQTSSYDGVQGIIPSRLYNPDFSWEVTKKLEVALEIGLFKEKINLTAGWYRNRSSSQLVGVPLPATTGFTNVQSNLGATVENRGWEFSLQTKNIKNKNLSWDTSINFTIPKNILLAFPGLEGSTYANSYVVGYSTAVKKLYHYQGIDPVTGIYKFEDVNGDNKLDSKDRTAIKDLQTHWYGGVQNNLIHKSWSLNMLVQLSKTTQNNIWSGLGGMQNLPVQYLNYWSPDNPNAVYQKPSTGANPLAQVASANMALSDAGISTVYDVRLTNLALHYSLPKLFKYGEVSIYLQGQNLWTYSNYKGVKPEIVLGYTPPLRHYAMGINLKF